MIRFIALLLVVSSGVPAHAMGPTEKTHNSLEPHFIQLDPDENSYSGTIIDKGNNIQFKNISFNGSTRISGMRKEEDDSISILDLSRVQRLSIRDPFHQSVHHSTSDGQPLYILVDITFMLPDHNTKTESYLIPHEIVFSAEEVSTGVQKSWLLRNIDSLSIDHSLSAITLLERELEEHDHSHDESYFNEKERSTWGTIKRYGKGLYHSFKAFLNLD